MAGALAKLSDSYTVIVRGQGLSPTHPLSEDFQIEPKCSWSHKGCRIEREKEKKERKKERKKRHSHQQTHLNTNTLYLKEKKKQRPCVKYIRKTGEHPLGQNEKKGYT